MMSAEQSPRNRVAALWGVIGASGIILFAIVRIAPHAIGTFAVDLEALHWVALVVNVIFMAWSEGYRGFQLKFSPRVAARALYLRSHSTSLGTQLLAPLFCIGYFSASKRTLIVAWAGTIAIVIFVLLIHRVDQPWRGIIDAGVVVGLSWGLISMITTAVNTFRTNVYQVSPDMPDRYNGD